VAAAVTILRPSSAAQQRDVDLKLIGEEGYGADKLPDDHLR
jgi:hypothetical protein